MTATRTKVAPRLCRLGLAGVFAALVGACTTDLSPGGARPTTRSPVTGAAAPPSPRVVVPEGTYYEPVDANVRVVLAPIDLPLDDARIERPDGALAKWTTAPDALRDRVRKNGFAVVTGGKRARLADLYVALRDAHVPFTITMDAMIQIAHMAIDRMLADAEARTMGPALAALLRLTGTRLDAESAKVTTDLDVAYDSARGLFAVARALGEKGYSPPRDLEGVVLDDARKATAAAPARGSRPSAALGVPVDFDRLALRGALLAGDPEAASFRALQWLGTAPLVMGSRVDAEGGIGDVYEARTRTRAALLVARLLSSDVDPLAADAFDRVAKPLQLLRGTPDDVSPRELLTIAAAAKVDGRTSDAIQNVSRIDRVRTRVGAEHHARIVDGVRAPQMRVFGASSTPDTEVLQALVSPALASRTMPAGLDVVTWLGAREAPTIVRELEPDEPATYTTAMAALSKQMPPEDGRHGSLAWSGLAALSAYVGASTADGVVPATATWAWRRRKVEVALGGWTTMRHDGIPFTRIVGAPLPAKPAAAPRANDGAPALGFVEPHPEAIARLIALVEQSARGLVALGAIERPAQGSISASALDVLRTCLAIALREANDDAFEAEQAHAIAELPDRIADLEARLAPSRGADRPLIVEVHEDRATARVLEEATGAIDDLYVVVREPHSGRLVLTVGASIAAHEHVTTGPPLTDADWRARMAANPPLRASWTGAYVVGAVSSN